MRSVAPASVARWAVAQPVRGWRRQLSAGVGHTIASLIFSQASNAVIGAAQWLIATHLYSVEAVGQNAALIGASTFIANASLLGLDYTIVRHLPGLSDERRASFLGVAFISSGFLAMALSAAAAPFVLPTSVWSSGPEVLAVGALVAAAGMLVVVGLVGDAVLLATGRPGAIVKKNVIAGLVRLVLVVAFSQLAFQSSILAAYTASWACAAALLFYFVRRDRTGPVLAVNRSGLTALLRLRRYAGFSYAATMVDNASMSLLPLLILKMTDARNAGSFQIAWLIASMLFIVPTGVARALFTHRSNDTLAVHGAARVTRLLIAATAVIAALAIVASAPLLALIGPAYAPGAGALRWLAASLPVIAYSSSQVVTFRVDGRVWWLLICSTAFLVSLFAGVTVLLPRVGLTGVGIAWFIGQILFAALVTVALRVRGRSFGAKRSY